MTSTDQPLFKQYPLNGQAKISTGEVPTPYHIYDGYGLFIGGTANLTAVRDLLKPEAIVPLQTRAGEALMGIWICNFTEASLGPHHELQFSIFVSKAEAVPVETHPLTVLKILLTQPETLMMCHGLWNNTPAVLAYNRELLGLNAKLSVSSIEREGHSLGFAVKDQQTGALILSGQIQQPQQASMRANLAMMGLVGFGPLMAVAQQPWLSVRIVNPVGEVLGRNAVAESFTKNTANVIRYFEPKDKLEFGETPYRALGFKPQFVQYMDGFKFVYLNPK